MKSARIKTLSILLVLALSPMYAHGENLMDVYQQALAQDALLSQQQAQRHMARENVPLARSGLLPQLNAGLSFSQANGRPASAAGSGHARSRNQSITLKQSIIDLGKYANLKAAKAEDKSAEAQYQADLQDLIIRVSSAYFDVLTARDKVIVSKALEHQLARQLDQAKARFKAGISDVTDVEDAKAQHDASIAQHIQAQNQLDDAREALSVITGQPTQGLEVLAQDLPMQPPAPNKLATWVNSARNNNPLIAAQQLEIQASKHNISAARAGRLPTLDASISYDRNASWRHYGNPAAPGSNQNGASIGLTLTVPLFEGGGTHARIKQSIYQREAAKAALTQQTRQVTRDTRNHFRSVNAGISQVKARRQAIKSAKSSLDSTQAGYKVGTRTIVDVLQAQQNLANARLEYSQARHQLIISRLLLKQDAGDLTVKDVQTVNALLVPEGDVDTINMVEDNG